MVIKNEPAAVLRAVQTFEELSAADRAEVLGRLTKGEPKKGLVGMARVEEINGEVSEDGKGYLLTLLRKAHVRLVDAEPAELAAPYDDVTIDACADMVQRAREDGETDHRQMLAWIRGLRGKRPPVAGAVPPDAPEGAGDNTL